MLHLSRNGNSFRSRIFHLYLSPRCTFFPFIDFVDDIALENCQAENIALVRRTGVVILLGEGESRPKEYAGLS